MEEMKHTQIRGVIQMQEEIQNDLHRLKKMIREVISLAGKISKTEHIKWRNFVQQYRTLLSVG